MVETLVNVKNNKMRAIPGGEIAAEATQKMKRFLGGLTKKRHSESASQLNSASLN
jgi:nucleolar MIF4G domain-containing protein 1